MLRRHLWLVPCVLLAASPLGAQPLDSEVDESATSEWELDEALPAAFVDPACVRWERTQAPRVDEELNYDFSRTFGEVVRIHQVDKSRSFDLLEEALRRIDGGSE